jgi:flagellar biosynthetic protein FlhB
MAEEQDDSQKTEEPTQKRIEEARKRGDVAKSQDVPVWFLLMAAAGLLAASGPVANGIAEPLARIMDHPHAFQLEGGGAQRMMAALLAALAVPLITVFGGIFVAALLGHVIQHRPLWSFEKVTPKLDKLDPMKGVGRMFGPQAWMNLLKSGLKMTAGTVAMIYAVWPERGRIAEAGQLDMVGMTLLIQSLAGRLLIAAVVTIGVLAGLDYFLVRQSFMKRMRMSRQEVKDEVKQQEGDPHIKAKLRQIRMERSRRRMLQAVAKATVVVTNPTHYSVALRYDPDKDAAPVCVAKGVDDLAMRIREKAREAEVPLVENVPLARALFATAELDEPVPREHFEAVAKVIGFVMSAAKGRRRRR